MSSIAELVADIGFNIDQATIDGFKATLINTQNQLKSVFGEQYNLEIKDNTKEVKENIKENIEKPINDIKDKKISFGLMDILSIVNGIKSVIDIYGKWRNYKKQQTKEEKKENQSNKFLMAEYGAGVKKEKEKEADGYVSLGEKMLAVIPIIMAVSKAASTLSKIFQKDLLKSIWMTTKAVIKNTIAWLANPMTWVVIGIMAIVGALIVMAKKFGWFNKIIEFTGKTWDAFLYRLGQGCAYIVIGFQKLFGWLKKGWDGVKDTIIKFASWFKNKANEIWNSDKVKEYRNICNQEWGKIKDGWSKLWSGDFKGALASFKSVWDDIITGWKNLFTSFVNWLVEKIQVPIKWISDKVEKVKGWFGGKKEKEKENNNEELTNNLKSNLSATAPSVNNTNSSSKQDNRQITTTINVDGSKNPKETAREISNLQDEINNSSVVLNG